MPTSISDIKPGDTVLRSFGVGREMPMRVSKVDDDLIYCGNPDDPGACWTFCRSTGWEIDHDLGWGPTYGVSGTRLVAVIPA